MPAILGLGGYAKEIAAWLIESGAAVDAFCRCDKESTAQIKSLEITEFPIDVLSEPDSKYEWLVGINPANNILSLNLDIKNLNWAAPFIHEFSHVSTLCHVLSGTVIGPFSYFGTNVKVSSCCLINAGVKIHFDTVLGAFVTVGSNTVIGANCRVGNRVVIGQNCTIADNVYLAPGSIIVANTAVYDDVDSPGIYANATNNMDLNCIFDLRGDTCLDDKIFNSELD